MTIFLPLVLALLFSTGIGESPGAAAPDDGVAAQPSAELEQTEVFLTSWDMEYGYELWRPNDLNTPIFVRFSDPEAEAAFGKFEAEIQSGMHVGKKTYCECSGRLHHENGIVSYFEVRKARLFSE
jgi:hypothetical protein